MISLSLDVPVPVLKKKLVFLGLEEMEVQIKSLAIVKRLEEIKRKLKELQGLIKSLEEEKDNLSSKLKQLTDTLAKKKKKTCYKRLRENNSRYRDSNFEDLSVSESFPLVPYL
ncbi:uncharacterized protein [Temnothorax nylanderi]|uniref:uncharacterized protein n=1 Tax=Temnothorax nylanderi TaxID=102681 RepID=UPI003A8557DD